MGKQPVIYSQAAFALGLVCNSGLCGGSQKEPEASRQILPTFPPVVEVLDPRAEPKDTYHCPPPGPQLRKVRQHF